MNVDAAEVSENCFFLVIDWKEVKHVRYSRLRSPVANYLKAKSPENICKKKFDLCEKFVQKNNKKLRILMVYVIEKFTLAPRVQTKNTFNFKVSSPHPFIFQHVKNLSKYKEKRKNHRVRLNTIKQLRRTSFIQWRKKQHAEYGDWPSSSMCVYLRCVVWRGVNWWRRATEKRFLARNNSETILCDTGENCIITSKTVVNDFVLNDFICEDVEKRNT